MNSLTQLCWSEFCIGATSDEVSRGGWVVVTGGSVRDGNSLGLLSAQVSIVCTSCSSLRVGMTNGVASRACFLGKDCVGTGVCLVYI